MTQSGRRTVGILGNCCTHGEFVALALKHEPAATIVAGWEDDPRRAAGLSAAIGLDLASSPEALLADSAIDIIAVACSPHEKAAWVEKAAQAGKHILLNKPMAESLDSAWRIERAVAGSQIQLVYDIPVIVRFHPVTARLLDEVRAGRYGRAINYTHTFSFTFSTDFPLAAVWPERLDPPSRSGGGELTNLGCYAVDYMIGLWGRPRSIQAKSSGYWDVYREARRRELRPGDRRLRRLLRRPGQREAAARIASIDGRGRSAQSVAIGITCWRCNSSTTT